MRDLHPALSLLTALLALSAACSDESVTPAATGDVGTDGSITDTVVGIEDIATADGSDGDDTTAGFGCDNTCAPVGATRCGPAGIETCGLIDDDVCLEWSPSVACAQGRTCTAGACSATCTSECNVLGATRCSGNGVQTCSDLNGDLCLEWSATTDCGAGESCSGGVCATGCSNECTTTGATRCSGLGVQSCGEHDGDECLDWSDTVPCPSQQTCSGGTCATDCIDECSTPGVKACSGSSVITCGQSDTDTCLEWSTPQSCGAGKSCSGGICGVECVNECDTLGTTTCSANGVQECGNTDADACFEWGTTVACPEGQTCSVGACSTVCLDECPEEGARRCSGGGTQICGNVDADACLDWGSPAGCPEGQTCSAGACAELCTSDCSVAGATRCGPGGVETCGNVDSDACYEWSNAVPCDIGETCSNGACAATCVDECPSGATACDGAGVKKCGQFDVDSCMDWSAPIGCPVPTTCALGSCVNGCTDECPGNDASCEGSAVRTCGQFDADVCLDLGSAVPCEAGLSCSSGVCKSECTNECDTGDVECVSTLGRRSCGNADLDGCTDWELPVACPSGSLCSAGACGAAPPGNAACSDVLACRNGCDADAACILGCDVTASTTAKPELAAYDACIIDHACVDPTCPVYFCTTESAACAFEASGDELCIDVLDCIWNCETAECVAACEATASLEAQHDLYRYYGCLALYCNLADQSCIDDITDSGGLCSVEFAVCLGPDDPGLACNELTDCIGSCIDKGGTIGSCEDQCLPGGNIVGQTEYFALDACTTKFGCGEGFCLSENCAFEMATCISPGEGDGDCAGLVSCLAACSSDACAESCYFTTDLQDQIVYAAMLLCLQGACPDGGEACQAQAYQTSCSALLALCFQ